MTALEANGEMDAGDVWASVGFPMRAATKSSLYRNEVTEAAVAALASTLEQIAAGGRPRPLGPRQSRIRGRLRPPMRQADRAIDWDADDTAAVLRKIRAADGHPGVEDEVAGQRVRLFDAHPEGRLRGNAGDIIAQRDGAICRATVDGAVWVTHLQRADGSEPRFKLPAATVLGDRLAGIPDVPLAPEALVDYPTWRPIRYEESGGVGWLHFPFYNGAMGTAHCEALLRAYRYARSRPTRVIVLMGGPDFWSNGIHLNLIEAAEHPAEESWRNINAMDDLVRDIVVTDRQLTIAALQGNAGAGGVFLALAADRVYARDGVILNPHYKGMGNLYGSEYWTYLLPRRVGAERARAVTQNRLPVVSARQRRSDSSTAISDRRRRPLRSRSGGVRAVSPPAATIERMLADKMATRNADESARPLAAYRDEELGRMKLNFFGFDPSYHVARYHFVNKVPRSRTPLWLARHRGCGTFAAAAD